MQNLKENLIVEKSFKFSLKIIKYTEELGVMKKFVLGNQLLRSGTSIGASIHEAQNAESKLDLIHKMKIAAKEADECKYWLLLCKHSENYPDCQSLITDIDELIRILSKIIATSKTRTTK
jgi:four helix bundle protein